MIDTGLLSPPAPTRLPDTALGGNAVLLTVPLPRPLRTQDLSVTRDGRPVKGPLVVTIVTDVEGRPLAMIALPVPAGASAADERFAVTVEGPDGRRLFDRPVPAPRDASPLDRALMAQVAPADRPRLLRSLAESAGLFFRLYDDPSFVRSVRSLLDMAAPLGAGMPIRIGRRLLLLPLKPGAESIDGVLLIGAGALRRNPFRPFAWTGKTGRSAALLLELPDAVAGDRVDLLAFSKDGVHRHRLDVRKVRPAADLDSVIADDPARALAAQLFGCVVPYLAADESLAALVRRHTLAGRRPERHLPIDNSRHIAGRLDVALEALDGGLFLRGWLYDPLDLVEGWTAVSALGKRRTLPPPAIRYGRAELNEALSRHPLSKGRLDRDPGFLLHVPGPQSALPGLSWHLELALKDGSVVELVPPPPPQRADLARGEVLFGIAPHQVTPAMIADAIVPAATALQRACLAGPRVKAEHRFGPAIAAPHWSVVIPLYKTLDYLRHQFLAFFADPDFRRAELVLVLDSPEQEDQLVDLLRGLDLIYGLSVRLIVHHRNLGYAAAVNSGAGAARAPWLMLLNSDVLPSRPGWLSAMTQLPMRHTDVGAVGPKLLFEDESIQHAGLCFWRDPRGDWRNRHFHKGYAADHPPANRSRRVPGVTGACILVARAVFEQVGGISEDYVIGDFEDSDFCLKLRAQGLGCWYESSVELYHFERRSILRHDGYTRTLACEVNRWLHERRWAADMAAAMEEAGAEPGALLPAGAAPFGAIRERMPA